MDNLDVPEYSTKCSTLRHGNISRPMTNLFADPCDKLSTPPRRYRGFKIATHPPWKGFVESNKAGGCPRESQSHRRFAARNTTSANKKLKPLMNPWHSHRSLNAQFGSVSWICTPEHAVGELPNIPYNCYPAMRVPSGRVRICAPGYIEIQMTDITTSSPLFSPPSYLKLHMPSVFSFQYAPVALCIPLRPT